MKSKKLIIILMVILVVLIIVAGGFAFVYLKTDILKPTDKLFAKYLFQKNNLTDIIQLDYLKAQDDFKKNNSYTSEGELLIENENSDGLEPETIQIMTSSKYDNISKRNSSEAILKKGENDLFKISYVNDDKIYALKSEQVYEHFIGIRNENLDKFITDMGLAEEGAIKLPDALELENINTEDLINAEDLQYLKDNYYQIIVSSIPKDKYSKANNIITIGSSNADEKTYNVEQYNLTLNQQDIKLIIYNVLTKAKEDERSIRILENMLFSIGMDDEQISEINIPLIIEDILEDMVGVENEDFTLTISVYQSNGKTIRTLVTLNDETSIKLDVIENTDTNKKILITIETLSNIENNQDGQNAENVILRVLLTKTVSQNAITYTNAIEMEGAEGTYSIEVENNIGNVINNTISNSIYINIQNSNGDSRNISYSKEIKKAETNIEVPELNYTNTVIVNEYPREQLEIFFGNIFDKLGQELGNAAHALSTSDDSADGAEETGGIIINIPSVCASVLAISNANGLNPIASVAGTTITTVVDYISNTFNSDVTDFNEQVEVYDALNEVM